LPSHNSGSFSSLKVLLRRPSLMLVFALTVIVISAQFTAYSYIEPFALKVAHLSSSQTTTLLLIYGGAGFIGSYVFGKFAPLFPKLMIPLFTLGLGLSMLLLLPLSLHLFGFHALSLLWGISIIGFSLALQAKTLNLAADATDVAMAIYSGLYNVGIGGGALLGSIITAQAGLYSIGWMGGLLALLGLFLSLYLVRRADFIRI